jgi:hypothetical protein
MINFQSAGPCGGSTLPQRYNLKYAICSVVAPEAQLKISYWEEMAALGSTNAYAYAIVAL